MTNSIFKIVVLIVFMLGVWDCSRNTNDNGVKDGSVDTDTDTGSDSEKDTNTDTATDTATDSNTEIDTDSHTDTGTNGNDLEYAAYYGYQCWHYAEGDGRAHSNSWKHWFEENIPDADHIHGDMWPDFREYPAEKLYDTNMKYSDGSAARLYSCFDSSTIDLHMKWVRDYGLKGVALQRFTTNIHKQATLEFQDKKILDMINACEKYGVKFWIWHDVSGDEGMVQKVIDDWKHLVDDLGILDSPTYAYQNGLPAYGLWGLGGFSGRTITPAQAGLILEFMQNPTDSKYRAYVMGGVPSSWRTNPDGDWPDVINRLDMISPWRTIFSDPSSSSLLTRMQEDLEYCNNLGIDYLPVVSPGASSMHLRDDPTKRNWMPRDGGNHFWKQVYEVKTMGSRFMYVAMFDEVDEGTAMYKQAETTIDLPVGAELVPLDEDNISLPSDWYLRLGGEAQKMLEGSSPLKETIPIEPDV